jgi:hypothetical protein
MPLPLCSFIYLYVCLCISSILLYKVQQTRGGRKKVYSCLLDYYYYCCWKKRLAVARSNFLTPDCLVLFGAPGSLLSFNVGPAAQFSKKKKKKTKQ